MEMLKDEKQMMRLMMSMPEMMGGMGTGDMGAGSVGREMGGGVPPRGANAAMHARGAPPPTKKKVIKRQEVRVPPSTCHLLIHQASCFNLDTLWQNLGF